MDVLQHVLQFMIRPAQRINNPRAIRSSFVVPQERIVELARGWNHVSVDLLRIAKDLEVTPKMMTLNLQFYRTKNTTESNDEGNQIITTPLLNEDLQKSDIDIFLSLINKYNVPKEYQFELANRIRIAKHINQPDSRRQLLSIRILAISIMCKTKPLISYIFRLTLYVAHAVSETTAQNKVFIYEPYLISQLAELISPEKQVDIVSLQP